MKQVSGRMAHQINERRIGVKDRLEYQLKAGTKPVEGVNVPLEEKDIKRINKELEVLNKRITSPEVARSTRTKKRRSK